VLLKRLIIAAAVASGVVLVSATSALAGPLVVISGPSPYAGCSTNAGSSPGINFASGEVEPQVAVNPADTHNIVASFQQDRWSNGGAHGIAVGFSSNGGATWGETTVPFSICAPNAIIDPFTGAPYGRASDPWTSIGSDGTAYTVGLLATNTAVAGAGNNDTGVAAVTSSDGGKTWGNARLIKSDQGTSPVFEFTKFFNDKESVTADPVKAGTAYVVWDRTESPGNSPDAVLRAAAFAGPTWFSMTTDGGFSWSAARPIFDPGNKSQTIGNEIVVDPRTGVLYDFFDLFTASGKKPLGDNTAFIKSTDGGATWSDATVVANQQDVADVDPNTGQLLRTGGGLPSAAIDSATGQLYVVWTDSRFVGGAFNQVVISTSTDGGATWSAPAVVSTSTTRPSFTPTVAVNSAGAVGVTFYDLRELAAGNTTTLPTDYWLKTSPRGGGSFSSETHLAGSFNLLVAPNAGGFFLGDYEGLATAGTTFHPAFIQVNCSDSSCAEPNDPTDLVTTAV
jgi:hypothetical protein